MKLMRVLIWLKAKRLEVTNVAKRIKIAPPGLMKEIPVAHQVDMADKVAKVVMEVKEQDITQTMGAIKYESSLY